jgi:hypothetical protein
MEFRKIDPCATFFGGDFCFPSLGIVPTPLNKFSNLQMFAKKKSLPHFDPL